MNPDTFQPQIQTFQDQQVSAGAGDFLGRTFSLDIRGFEITPTYWQAAAIIFLIFLLLLSLARMRYLYVHWSMGRSAVAFTMWGFVLAIIFEGLLLVGGKTLLTEVLRWENAPKPISTMLDEGRYKLIQVLGADEEIPVIDNDVDFREVIGGYQSLSPDDAETVKKFICEP